MKRLLLTGAALMFAVNIYAIVGNNNPPSVAATAAIAADVDSLETALAVSSNSLQAEIDGLDVGTEKRFWFTDDVCWCNAGYKLMIDTVPFTAESGITQSVGSSRVCISSWSYSWGTITTIPEGEWTFNTSYLCNVARVRFWYEVYQGSGTGARFIGGSHLSNIVNTTRESQRVHMSTGAITTAQTYWSVALFAEETSAGTNPNFTMYVENPANSNIVMPAVLAQVSVTKAVAGTGVTVSPVSGVGDVTISVSSNVALAGDSQGHATGEAWGICPSSSGWIRIAGGSAPASSAKWGMRIHPAGGVQPVTQSAYPDVYQYEVNASSRGIRALTFPMATTSYACYQVPVNADYSGGTVDLNLAWISTGVVVGVVKWNILVSSAPLGAIVNNATLIQNSYTLTQTVSGTAFATSSTTFTIAANNFGTGAEMFIDIRRQSGTLQDTFASSVWLIDAWLREN